MTDADTRPTRSSDAVPDQGRPVTVRETTRYWLGAAVVAGLVLVPSLVLGDDSFERFFGSVPPLVVTMGVVVVGAISLRVLAFRGWLPAKPLPVARLYRLALIGAAFALPAVFVDSWIQFPEDMNAAWPESLLFYPAIAFLAEIVFHVAPLALLLAALRWELERYPDDTRRAVIAIVVIAAVETLFHTVDVMTGSDQRLALFVVPQLAAFGFYQVAILRRDGFLAMLSVRLGYYLIWHGAQPVSSFSSSWRSIGCHPAPALGTEARERDQQSLVFAKLQVGQSLQTSTDTRPSARLYLFTSPARVRSVAP